MSDTPERGRAVAREAILLASKGQCRCRGCKQVLPLKGATTVWAGGALAFAACFSCLASGRRVRIEAVSEGVLVTFDGTTPDLSVQPSDAGLSLLPASSPVRREIG